MIVIDASVIIKWIKQEESHRDQALLLYSQHLSGQQKIIVPKFLFLEVANALATQTNFSPTEVKTGLNFIFQANIKTHTLKHAEIIKAALLAKKYHTSVYDMLYAVIAKS